MGTAGVKPATFGAGRTVLIVDDVQLIRSGLARAFSSYGFVICGEADNGQTAIELVKKTKPDLILLDLSMPVMTGLQAAPELRRLAPKASIILLTMYGADMQRLPVSELGIDLVLSKTEDVRSIMIKAHGVTKTSRVISA